MASMNSSLSHLTESQFKLAPIPDMVTGDFSSGDESFVVLGHSLTDGQSLVSNVPATAPVVQNSIIDRIEENVNIILADLSNTSAECPLPAVENHFQLKNNHESILSVSSEVSPGEIDKKLTTILAENQQLKETILQNNLSMKSQYHKIMNWHAEVEKTYKIHREKLEQAKQYITSLKDEIANLKDANQKQANEISIMKEADKEKCIKDFQGLNLTNDTPSGDKVAELTKLLAISNSENEKLKADVLRLNLLLQASTINTSVEKKSVVDSQKYRNDQIEGCQEEIKTLRHQLMVAQQNITQIECCRQMLHTNLTLKENEICKLVDLLKKFKYTEDDMFALNAQLDVYKADFETERKAKESIIAAKNQVADDLQQVHSRNRELQEEVEILRSHTDFSYIPRDRSSSGASSQKTSQKYECPKCQFVFKTYEALENHVHRCLDLEGTLP